MATTAQRKLAVAKAERMMKGTETVIRDDRYMADLLIALNYYNVSHDDKEKKSWYIKHLAATDKKTAAALTKVDEYHFRHAGILARLMDGGSVLRENEMRHFRERSEFLLAQLQTRQKSQDMMEKKSAAASAMVANASSIQQRMDDKAHELSADIDGAIDEIHLTGVTEFSTKAHLLSNSVSGAVSKRIADFYTPRAAELREALTTTDKQLKEAYSNFSKRDLKKMAEFVESIVADCSQQVQSAKFNRAPRVRKPIPAAKLAAKMKFLKEHVEYGLKSVRPETIVDASEAWVFNTKTRKLTVYKAESTLSIKGTAIVGFSLSDSKQVTIRKPAEYFKDLALGKRALTAKFKTITVKATTPNGRLNDDTIILGAF